MKISVLGCGAMGSIYAGFFADNGHEVIAIDTWGNHVAEIRKKGLRIEGISGTRQVSSIFASTDIKTCKDSDIFIIATKASNVSQVAANIAEFIKSESIVITIQNGLGSAEQVAKHIPKENIILGVADGFGASIPKAGHVHHNAMKLIRLGEMGNSAMNRVENIALLWVKAGFNVKAFSDINQLVWEKFICNVTFSGPCTVFDCKMGQLIADNLKWKVALGCMSEAYYIGKEKKINFSFSDPENYVLSFGKNMPDARPSMLLDYKAKRLSEIDYINGMVSELGADLGVKTPYNDTITSVVKSMESKF